MAILARGWHSMSRDEADAESKWAVSTGVVQVSVDNQNLEVFGLPVWAVTS